MRPKEGLEKRWQIVSPPCPLPMRLGRFPLAQAFKFGMAVNTEKPETPVTQISVYPVALVGEQKIWQQQACFGDDDN